MRKLDISRNAKSLMVDLIPFISYETGALVSPTGKPLTIPKLARELGEDERSVRRQVKELVEKSILAIAETGSEDYKAKTIIANPYVFVRGNKISKGEAFLFRNSPFCWD